MDETGSAMSEISWVGCNRALVATVSLIVVDCVAEGRLTTTGL
jgi:hypothetical protein